MVRTQGASSSLGCRDCEGNKLNRRQGWGGARLVAGDRKLRHESGFGGVGELGAGVGGRGRRGRDGDALEEK